MRSATSYFNKTVFWQDQKRFWPLTAGYALLWLLLLPFNLFTNLQYRSRYYYSGDLADRALSVQADTLDVAAVGGCIVAFIFGILFAMAMFSYLTNPRATNGLHELPARRETLYVTHCLAGLCCQLAAQALAAALTGAVLAAYGCFDARTIGLCFLGTALPTLLFYFFGVLCMVFTGQILAAPVFYGILNFLAVGMEWLVSLFAGNFLYGYRQRGRFALALLSPPYKLITSQLGASLTPDSAVTINGLGLLWAYAGAGLVFAALGLLFYRRRQSEATGTTVAIGWARPIFKYGVTLCTALALGQLLYYLFFGQYSENGSYSLAGTFACMAASGLIGYFTAEMLLKKSFRVWKSGWRGALVVTGLLVAFGFLMSRDLTGYEAYVPDPESVESVTFDLSIYGVGRDAYGSVSDPATIRLVTDAHRAIARDKRRQQSLGREYAAGGGEERGYFQVSYRLKDGRTVRRQYSGVAIYASELSDACSPAAAFTALYNDETVRVMRALGLHWRTGSMALDGLRITGGYCYSYYFDAETGGASAQRDLTAGEAKALYDAILLDAAEGNVNASLFADQQPLLGELELFVTFPEERASGRAQTELVSATLSPELTKSMTRTLDALREMGLTAYFEE